VEKVCKDLQDASTVRLQERDRETNLFRKCVQNACYDNKQQSLKYVLYSSYILICDFKKIIPFRKCEDYMSPKEEICETLRQLLAIAERKKSADDSAEMDRVRVLSRNLLDRCEVLKDELLILEIELQEQIEVITNQRFKLFLNTFFRMSLMFSVLI
jgi:hypothetical protein